METLAKKAFSTLIQVIVFSLLLLPTALAQQSDTTPKSDTTIESGTTSTVFTENINLLTEKSFKKKEHAISSLISSPDPRKLKVLKFLLAGNLFYIKKNKQVVFAEKTDSGYKLTSVMENKAQGTQAKKDIKKVTVNNKLRRLLRKNIAQLSLGNSDVSVRLTAVADLLGKIDDETLALLQNQLQVEKDPDVRQSILMGLAISDVNSSDKSIQLKAIKTMADSNHPMAKNKLMALLEQDNSGNFLELDKNITTAAQKSLKAIEGRIKMYNVAETLFFGLSLGSVLLLAAIGLAITFGVMGVINMAHGELIMLGAYTTYVVQLLMPNHIEYSLFVAIPLAFLVSGMVGIAIERGIIRFLYGRPLETLLATFGISLFLQQLVRSVFSPLNRSVETPMWMSGSWEINSLFSLTYNRLYIVVFSLVVFALLVLILKKTRLGLQVRAVSQNRAMARAMGVRSAWVDAMTFGLGSGIAGVAGVALSQLTNVGPNLGQSYIIDSFMVVVFGGVGNLWGTLVGAFSLGVANKILEPWSGAVLAKILVLVFIILFIQKRPRGLFPQKGRAAEN